MCAVRKGVSMKKIISIVVALFVLASLGLGVATRVSADTNENANANSNANSNSNSNSNTNASVNLACMQAAVGDRETAIATAESAFHTTWSAALAVRKAALLDAWAKTNRAERRAAIKAAWKAYEKSMKTARKTYRKARHAAWVEFNRDRKACRGTGSDEGLGEHSDGVDTELK